MRSSDGWSSSKPSNPFCNGLGTRPVELECHMESAGETCAYFKTGPEFVPVLLRQRDHARAHQQPDRVALFDGLIRRTELPLDNDHTYNAGYATSDGDPEPESTTLGVQQRI